MNYCLALLIILFTVTSCEQFRQEIEYEADKLLNNDEKSEFIYSIIRYMGKMAPGTDHHSKFSSEYDQFYRKLSDEYSLEYLYSDPESHSYFFLTTRVAPSLYGKKVALGGVLRYDPVDTISYYEEKFRTWKMPDHELMAKSQILFQEMIEGNDLTRYHRENSGDEEYIEFPNPHTYFDTEKRQWITTLFDHRKGLQTGIKQAVSAP